MRWPERETIVVVFPEDAHQERCVILIQNAKLALQDVIVLMVF
jgi:hypothetical protein